MIKMFSKYLGKKYRLISLLAVFGMVMEVVVENLVPLVMANLIDNGIQAQNFNVVLRAGGLMVALALFGLLFGSIGGYFAADAAAGLAASLRSGIYRSIQRFSFGNLDKYSTAGLVTRLTTDVSNVQNSYQMILRTCMRAPATLIFTLALTFSISRKLSMIFLVALGFLLLVLILVIKFADKAFTRVFSKYDALNASVQENVTGIRVVKSFVREEFEIGRFKVSAENIYKLFVKAEGLVCFIFPALYLAVYGCMIGISWFGAHEVVAGSLTTGQLTSFFTYMISILMSLMMLAMVFVMITMSVASGRRIEEVLSEIPKIQTPEQPVTEVKDGSVVFSQVSFSYGKREEPVDWDNPKEVRRQKEKQERMAAVENGTMTREEAMRQDPDFREEANPRFVLSDVTLSVRSGETIGIIGGTGSSKTSLVSLIPRLYDATEGEVLVGGKNVKNYDLKALRDAVGMVLQKNTLFSGTIYDNLRWGNPDASDADCEEACRLACADEFVRNFPDGYHTWIEQGGSNVSGGQKQRLCIARALLKKPKILILDDSTSAVDTATDASIRKAFREKIPNTTKFIISQRISGVKDADRILVLEEGRVSGFGTHEELLKNNEIYASVVAAQTEGGGDFDEREEA